MNDMNVAFQKIMTCFHKMIHRPFSERSHVRTIFFQANHTLQPHHNAEVSAHVIMDGMLVLEKVQDVNIGCLPGLSCNVSYLGLLSELASRPN